MLCVIGDLAEDVVVWLDDEPRLGTDTPARIVRRRGGSAANVAAFAAAVGHRVRFVGALGTDPTADRLAASLASEGVDVRVQRIEGDTGTVVVLVGPDGERTMLPDRGVATELTTVADEWIEGCSWVHLPAYSLVPEPLAATSLGAALSVREAGGRISVDASSVSVVEAARPKLLEALRLLAPDLLLVTRAERAALGPGCEVPGWTVVKDGPRPVQATGPQGERLVIEVPAATTGARLDTTGAGDAFAAGVVCALDGGRPIRDALASGVGLAARVLRGAGAVLDGDG